MSFINDALAKAQTEKDSRYLNLENVLRTDSAEKNFRFRYPLMVVMVALVMGALCLTIIILWPAQGHNGGITSPTPQTQPAQATLTNASPEISRLYMDALNHQRNGDYNIAEVLYRQVLSLDQNHPYALNNLGVLQMIQKMPEKAIVLFERAASLKGDYVHPYYNLACLYAKQNKVEESLRYLQKAIAIKPDIREWAAKDGDFKNMGDNADFNKLVGKRVR
jgi:tetratricopeptide (TPR) repeat protein